MFDPWDQLDDNRRAIYAKGEAAIALLRKSIERWRDVGDAALALQEDAIAFSGAKAGKKYNAAWKRLATHVPEVSKLDTATRTAAVWMAKHWPEVTEWRAKKVLVPNKRNKRIDLNHPTVVKRHFDADHKPMVTKPARESNTQTIMRLQQELDDTRAAAHAKFVMLPRATAEEFAQAAADTYPPEFLKRAAPLMIEYAEMKARALRLERKAVGDKETRTRNATNRRAQRARAKAEAEAEARAAV